MKIHKMASNLSKYSRDLEDGLEKISPLMKKGRYAEAFALLAELYPALADGAFFFEDKNFSLSNFYDALMGDAERLAQQMAKNENLPLAIQENLFDLLVDKFVEKAVYRQNGTLLFDTYLTCFTLSVKLGRTDKMLAYLDTQLAEKDHRDFGFYAFEKFKLLYLSGKNKQALAFFERNRTQDRFEQQTAEFYLEEVGNIQGAKQLIIPRYQATIAKDFVHRGFGKMVWTNLMIKLCYVENNKELLKTCLLEDVLNERVYFNPYHIQGLKELCTTAEWAGLYSKLLARAQADDPKGDGTFPDCTAYFYTMNGEFEKLLELFRGYGASHIAEFNEYLLPAYGDELLNIYVPYFKKQLEKTRDRSSLDKLLSEMRSIVHDIPDALEPFNVMLEVHGARIMSNRKGHR